MGRTGTRLTMLVAAAAVIAAIAFVATRGHSAWQHPGETSAAIPNIAAPAWPVTIHRPAGPPRILTAELDPLGRPVSLACSSCHSVRPPDPATRRAEALDEFHEGLTYVHGDLSCLSCHHADDYDRLRLADGTSIEFADVMNLCSQCHGPQRTDYDHGAHGGMTGHWDLSRGPRVRNGCTDCHDPHAPAFPMMQPTFKPRDRFLSPSDHAAAGSDHE